MGIFRYFGADAADRGAARPEGDVERRQDEGRRRARRRVVGAVLLVMMALLVLPVIFEAGDPPIADTVAIDIPAKDSPVEFSPSGEPTGENTQGAMGSNKADAAADESTLPSGPISATAPVVSAPAPIPATAPVRQPIPPIRAGYALQVGAFASNASAQALQQRITTAGLNAYIETLASNQGTRHRVRVGPFPTREAAEQARSKLKLLGLDNTLIDAL